MHRLPQVPETYDRIYATGGHNGVYDLPYWQSIFYPLDRAVLRLLGRHRSTSLLDVGCGTGAFAHLVLRRTRLRSRGFDFSPVAVARAVARTGRSDRFSVADAMRPEAYAGEYDAIVCTEVLEHLPDDLGVMAHWPSGCRCFCSVPNFDADTHERVFLDEAQVRARYAPLLDIDVMMRVKRPPLPDLSWRSYARAALWCRREPSQLWRRLGGGPFTSGWFVFSGRRR
jgi:2-polyprenyl-3-methyl-5-hydroxy-6-metoxy-1,4-benzoquinol methylase